jgi:hypothetical protein
MAPSRARQADEIVADALDHAFPIATTAPGIRARNSIAKPQFGRSSCQRNSIYVAMEGDWQLAR